MQLGTDRQFNMEEIFRDAWGNSDVLRFYRILVKIVKRISDQTAKT